jgi:hypothetical protein
LGSVASRGANAETADVGDDDLADLKELLALFGIDAASIDFTKLRSGRKLWNFSTKEPELWRAAL